MLSNIQVGEVNKRVKGLYPTWKETKGTYLEAKFTNEEATSVSNIIILSLAYNSSSCPSAMRMYSSIDIVFLKRREEAVESCFLEGGGEMDKMVVG